MAPIEKVQFTGLLTDHDIYLFKEGNHFKLYEKMGAHIARIDGVEGTVFAVWAPNAARVSVVGDFNGWNPELACPRRALGRLRHLGGFHPRDRARHDIQVSYHLQSR